MENSLYTQRINRPAQIAIWLGLALLLGIPVLGSAQAIRGRVTDAQTLQPLPGAVIALLSVTPIKAAVADPEGYFNMPNVPPGRATIRITMTGYIPRTYQEVLIQSGRDLTLEVTLQEQVQEKDEVVIEARSQQARSRANNEMALLSARGFDVEETRRYAGSRQDPARMASNYAGVSGANDGRNDIIIRGNSPSGLLWRLEGADIFNPNHFGTLGATGGPVGMINNNTLAHSDFLTGAFPAQYGNALAGVFDLRMRTGNQDRHEFLGQAGFNGFEAGAEGPLGISPRSSYLVNYRYSLIAVVTQLGLNVGTGAAVPYYQDASFKFHLPTEKAGTFSLFGLGGISHIRFLGADADSNNLYSDPFYNTNFRNRSGAVGLSHLYNFNKKTYGRLLVFATGLGNTASQDSIEADGSARPYFGRNNRAGKYSARYTVGYTPSARISFENGLFVDMLTQTLADSVRDSDIAPNAEGGQFRYLQKGFGRAWLTQAFSQVLYRPTPQLTLTGGLHYQFSSLGQDGQLEPRVGAQYQLTDQDALSLGAGLHSQLQQTPIYFTTTQNFQTGERFYTNRDLEMTRALHAVLGYRRQLTQHWGVKTEVYAQRLYNVPVEMSPSAYSVLNEGADFGTPDTDSLVNRGLGRNLGAEITVERTFHKGSYVLFTGSLFDSRYLASNGQWYNTVFNGNYIFNMLAGREWRISDRYTFALDIKGTWAGGRRYTPIDLDASRRDRQTRFIESESFSRQLKDYFRADVKLTLRKNGEHVGQEFFVDLQNITNRQNPFNQYWDPNRERMITSYQLGLFPNINYRINF